ncbi:hypothetical protein BOX15_Mlig002431g1 [Macrostomum lignano]|uniref:Tetraspanin n=1 Tax=Macrostomum lignano TaxID=282301 RepID=A0A267GFY9_9PLAT|nr:hypothetical protein BOX15_Mlig002431g1 [Macrostomum lignano]
MSIKRLSNCLLLSSSLFVLGSACLLVLYAVLTFSPGHHFHCCQPSGLSFAQASSVALLLPLLLALAGIFGWTSLRTGRVQATLLHLGALLLLAGTSLFLGAACFAGRDSALRVVERNFQLVRDCRTDWLVDRLQTELNCSGWNFTTAHRSVCPQSPSAGAAGVLGDKDGNGSVVTPAVTQKNLPDSGPCREPVTRLSGRLAGAALASGLALALLAAATLACQCAYQWRISDPDRRRQIGQERLELRRRRLTQQTRNNTAVDSSGSVNIDNTASADRNSAGPSAAQVQRQPPKRRAPERPSAVPTVVAGKTDLLLFDDGEV